MSEKIKEEIKYENNEIGYIAKKQKLVLWIFIGALVGNIGSKFFNPQINNIHALIYNVLAIAGLAFWITLIITVYFLAKGLKEKRPLVYSVGMILPLINLVVVLSLIGKATKILKANGIKVGLMGADTKEICSINPEQNG